MITDIILGRDIGVDVGSIEKELAQLWRSASTTASAAPRQVTRACSWNLVLHVSDPADFPRAKSVVDEAVRHVPSRTLLLRHHPTGQGRDVEAWVSANCQAAPGGGKLLCTEEITIETRGEAGAQHIPSLVRALLVPDVPTALWWAGAPPTDPASIQILLAGADRLVFDSALAVDHGDLAKLDALSQPLDRVLLVDLNWIRTGPVRSMFASLFDGEGGVEALRHAARVRLTVQPQGHAAARLLVGWLSVRLGWSESRSTTQQGELILSSGPEAAAHPVHVVFEDGSPQATHVSGICSIDLETTHGELFRLRAAGGAAAEAHAPRLPPRVLQLLDLSPPQLLVAALGSRGRDRLYASALHRAAALA